MKTKISLYNEKNLSLLRKHYPVKWNKLKYKNKEKWLTKEDYPTYNQLVEISKIFDIPFGYLFLNELPEKNLPIPHFRTKNGFHHELSDELYDTVMLVKKQQTWIREILMDWGYQPLPFAGKFNTETTPKEIIKGIKEILKLEDDWAQQHLSQKDALNFLINRFEEAGIYVVINGIVGNNTSRKLNVEEFRGFVIYDDIAPFVFINNNDFLSAKIFTLIHEFVHILMGKSASFDLRKLISADDEIEKFCDQCTAEFLVPTENIISLKKIDYDELANQFKVSQIVIARRLLDIGKINQEDFFNFYDTYKQKEIKPTKQKGGDFYNTVVYRYGKKFLNTISHALSNNEILHRDAYRLLSLKPKTADNLLKIAI